MLVGVPQKQDRTHNEPSVLYGEMKIKEKIRSSPPRSGHAGLEISEAMLASGWIMP